METRANYVLIGAFTLAGILGALGFFLWLAKVEVDRQYAYYDVLFDNVSGLGDAGDVRYNGLPVGQVTQIRLDPEDPSKVRVTLELAAETPVKTDTEATLEMQGVTGVSYVALKGGTADAPDLSGTSTEATRGQRPVIPSSRSAVQSIFEGAPELLNKAILLLEDVSQIVGPENRDSVTQILTNLAAASAKLDNTLTSVDSLTADISTSAKGLTDFAGRLGELAEAAETTLARADETLQTTTGAVRKAEGTIDAASATLETAGQAFASADVLLKERIPVFVDRTEQVVGAVEQAVRNVDERAGRTFDAADALMTGTIPLTVEQVRATAATLESTTSDLGGKAGLALEQYTKVGVEIAARAEQARQTLADLHKSLAEADMLMASLRQTSDSVDALIQGDGKALIAEARTALGSADKLMTESLPPLIEQARTTTANVDAQVATLSVDASTLMQTATARLAQAEGTLTRLDSALEQANSTMVSVQAASASVTQLAAGDGAALVAEARAALGDARTAIDAVNLAVRNDLPALMADLRSASANASAVVSQVGQDVSAFTGRLGPLADGAESALATATETFANANGTLAAISQAMANADGTLKAAQTTFDAANEILGGDVEAIISDIRATIANLDATIATAGADITSITSEVRGASSSANELVGGLNEVLQSNRYEVENFLRTGLPQFARFIEEGRRLVSNLERLSARVERDPARFLLGTQSSEFNR